MKTIATIALLIACATPACAQQVYINQATGQLILVQPTGTVGIGGVGTVGNPIPSTSGVAVVGGAGSVGSVYQPFNPGVAVIGVGQ